MYFTKIQKTKEQLEFMIESILLEYGELDDEHMIVLLSTVYNLREEYVKDALNSYKAMVDEDFEVESNKIVYGFV